MIQSSWMQKIRSMPSSVFLGVMANDSPRKLDKIFQSTASSHHFRSRKAVWLSMTFMALAAMLHPQVMVAQQGTVSNTNEASQQSAAGVAEYWTPERMRKAVPIDVGPVTANAITQKSEPSLAPDAVPGFAPGWKPGSGPQPDTNAAFMMGSVQPNSSPPFSPPSTPTDFGNYAPFQRYNLPMRYMLFPFSTIGKLFFRQNGSDAVCSASVIGASTIATAGHCVHSGNNLQSGWSSNFLFCPSYNRQNGQNPLQGCWMGITATTSSAWFSSRNFDRDYGCIVTAQTGTVHANKVGNITGWTGRTWNLSSKQAIHSFGYPSASPFPGTEIIVATSTEWYEVDNSIGDGQVSKYIGNDMGKGASGGPWWVSFAHPVIEYSDTDGSDITDPYQNLGGPFINGVNSHSRCNATGCPPGSVFTQEMGSSQFKNTSAAGESEDVFSICLSNQLNANAGAPMSLRLASVKPLTGASSRAASGIVQRPKGR